MIPDELIEQIRDAADLVGIVGESSQLKRTGSDYRGPCPFHGGTHRNFAVIPKKGLFYCYVCHESGDVFSYLMKRFGMDYPTAVRDVARRVGIAIPDRAVRTGPDPNEPLYGAIAAAHDWFTRQLFDEAGGREARTYLESRGLTRDDYAPLGLGYAPSGKQFLEAMATLGLAEGVLLDAGLIVRRDDGSVVPRFRGRLLFPIHDLRGRVVAFGGRLLREGEPKYLNSPETPVFHKGRELYNLHQARHEIRKAGYAVLVEGYFDVLRLVLGGVEPVVAPLGTGLTEEQATLLKRYTTDVTLLYDSDMAGLRATFRAGDQLLRQGLNVRVATMPPGEDPDSLVRSGGAAALAPLLRDAVDVLERKIQILERHGMLGGIEHRRAAIDRLLPTLRAAASPITRDLYLARVAERTGVSREVLAAEVAAAPPSRGHAGSEGTRGIYRPPSPEVPARAARAAGREGAGAERALLALVIESEHWLERARSEVPPAWFEDPANHEIFETLLGNGGRSREELFGALSPAAQAVWHRLMESSATLLGDSLDQTWTEACEMLEARPHLREYDRLTDLAQREVRHKELSARYPMPWRRHIEWLKRHNHPSPRTRYAS